MSCVSERNKIKIHLCTSVVGFLGGLVGFFVFVFAFWNIHAGLWSLIAGLLALVSLQFHVFYLYDTLDSHYNEKYLYYLRLFGIFMAVASLIAMIVYFSLTIYYDVPILPVGPSFMLPGVQSFLSFKWSVSVAYFSRFYMTKLQMAYTMA